VPQAAGKRCFAANPRCHARGGKSDSDRVRHRAFPSPRSSRGEGWVRGGGIRKRLHVGRPLHVESGALQSMKADLQRLQKRRDSVRRRFEVLAPGCT
jgi:hypothetical protein